MKLLAASMAVIFSLALVDKANANDKVVIMKQGEVALFTGLLVPEKRFIESMEAEVAAKKLKMELEVERRFTLNLEKMYKSKLQESTKPVVWHRTTSFNRWFGFTIGVVLTGLAVWGGAEVVKASGK